MYLTESAVQGHLRVYSVSVSIVDYSFPWKMFVDYLAMSCVLSVVTKRSNLLLSNGGPTVDCVMRGNMFS
jgi:hypothetical protein